jgi:hypothetical protein
MKKVISILVLSFLYSASVLEAQIEAIMSISAEQGYSQQQLNSMVREYGVYSLPELTQTQAAEIINRLQNNIDINKSNLTKPINPINSSSNNSIETSNEYIANNEKDFEPILAEILEIGMSKYFYLVDGNRIRGEIIDIVDQTCSIQTTEGVLQIPMKDILEETIVLTKTDDTRYKGALIKEDGEKLVLKSQYGDVTILKKEVEKMERFHGGRLAPQVESRKTFEHGEDELIGVFFDNNAFVLDPNTFFLSPLSLGYGFTDRFMITTRYGANLGGNLNLHPKIRVMYDKTANSEKALSIGFGIFRAYKVQSIISNFSHGFYMNGNQDSTLNKLSWSYGDALSGNRDIEDFLTDIRDEDLTRVVFEPYIVYSSRRKNPTGRGKVGWSVGLKTSNMLSYVKDNYYSYDQYGNVLDTISFNKEKYKIPYRMYAIFEYDLQKSIKFVASMWMDNSNRRIEFSEARDDYFGKIGDPMAFDGLGGKESTIDFDFGIIYAVNENFRFGFHFQQPYLDFHWEFFEF